MPHLHQQEEFYAIAFKAASDQVQLDKPPWSDANLQRGDRYRCPVCRGRVAQVERCWDRLIVLTLNIWIILCI
jgi:hypothetical protein